MVILANRLRSSNNEARMPSILSERNASSSSVTPPLTTNLNSGSFLSNHMGGREMAPDTRRNLSLSLTLAQWMPLPTLARSAQAHTAGRDGLLTPNISGSRPRLISISSASLAASGPTYPLTATQTEIRWNAVADTQHATDRFPRFAYLLRHGTHQPESESDEEHLRRSADPHSDPGRTHASLATLPDVHAQCGERNETALQSCAAASASGTLGHPSTAQRSSPSRDFSSARATLPAELPTFGDSVAEDQHCPDIETCTEAMASYNQSSSSASRSGSRSEQLYASTRKSGDRNASERIMAASPLSLSPSPTQHQSQASTEYEDADEDEHDQQAQDTPSQAAGGQGEGQPRKKKTRRAGVAITRVRRMQREVRRLAEDEEANAQRQPQPSLLLPVQTQTSSPVSPGPASAPPAPIRQFQGLSLSGASSPPPRAFSSPASTLARPSNERPTRSEPLPAHAMAHSRGPAYDRILEDGDDVVLLRLPGLGRPAGPSIWTYRPEERPRGGAA